MSYYHGLAAMNLEMSDRVPRTEYSAGFYWSLIKKVTGIDVDNNSDDKIKNKASSEFEKAWNYDFRWNTVIYNQFLPGRKTTMGHAEYAENGTDFKNEINCPFEEPEEVLEFDPVSEYGEIDVSKITKIFNQKYAEQKDFNNDAINTEGIYITCISGLIEIFGWDMLLMAAGIDAVAFGEMTNRYCNWVSGYFKALAESDIEHCMIHDDIVWTSGAFLRPDWYRKYVFPNYKKMFSPVLESGKKIIFTSDGNYTEFIDDIVNTGVNGFVLEPTTDMNYIAEKYGKTHVFIGNADTRILLSGSKQDIYNEVLRCMDIGKKCPGFFMAVGNHIPSNTPIENALYYNECYEKLSKR